MKKYYIAPRMELVITRMQPLLEGSVTSPFGLGWGGVDVDGSQEPGSRRYSNSLWDDDEEEW